LCSRLIEGDRDVSILATLHMISSDVGRSA
jgi:hypothetical protein